MIESAIPRRYHQLLQRALRSATTQWGPDWSPTHWCAAPGRIEQLGNHVDYNGGKVLAAAIDRTTLALLQDASPSEAALEVHFADIPKGGSDQLHFDEFIDWRASEKVAPGPTDYARGAIATVTARGLTPRVGRLVIAGEVPIGFGVSSSAALCVALTGVLQSDNPAAREWVLRAQEAENRAGAPCGTMDQSASIAGHTICYDAGSISWVALTPDLADLCFALVDSGVDRSLGTSSYPRRVEECREILETLHGAGYPDLPNLASFLLADLPAAESILSPVLFRRLRHQVSECERVEQGIGAVTTNDWRNFGELMTASGRSSALDYEVSHPVVESIVAEALLTPGVLGARMMGGGDGGAVLVLAQRDALANLEHRLQQAFSSPLRIEVVTIGEGAEGGILN